MDDFYSEEEMDFTQYITLSREEVIDEIIVQDISSDGPEDFLRNVLKNGFSGYKKANNDELIENYNVYYPDHVLTIAEERVGAN